ncbi:hypothetical protein CAEBREN_07282 [Caenorhabditis brenneri]|uniref:Uncharacterized protein n=1 Tax=Caenorhabditis brenneri TaxID=135651 RepID=G0PIS4_CAEBE|nr:hypothetical protein CAEBREN_07282 [Caenorhabditis brenneri]
MAKRAASATMGSEVLTEAKRMAVAMQCQRLVEDATRAPPRCKLCTLPHPTTACPTHPQHEKMDIAKQRRLCLLCLLSLAQEKQRVL